MMVSRRAQLRRSYPPSAAFQADRGAGSGVVFPMACDRRPCRGGEPPGGLRNPPAFSVHGRTARARRASQRLRPAAYPKKKSAPLSSSAGTKCHHGGAVGSGAGSCDPPQPRDRKKHLRNQKSKGEKTETARPCPAQGCGAATDASLHSFVERGVRSARKG